MSNHVLVQIEDGTYKPRMYFGNIYSLRERGENYKHYIVNKGNNNFEVFNTDPNDHRILKNVRCPKCSSRLERVTLNQYHCLICEVMENKKP